MKKAYDAKMKKKKVAGYLCISCPMLRTRSIM